MGTKLEELFVELVAKTDKLDAGLKQAVKSIDKASDKMVKTTDKTSKKTSKGFFNIANAASTMAGFIGGSIVLGAFNKLSTFVSNSFNNLRQFSRGIAEINTLLPRNAKLTKENTNQFIRFSKLYGQSTTRQTKAFYDIVSAGVKGTALQMRVLDQANKAAVAGISDVGIAADVLTSIMNSYASTGIDVTNISDILFQTVKEGKTTFSELASSVGIVAPLANSAGLAFSEMSGALAFLTKSGLSTSEATTGLRAILVGLTKPSDDAQKAARALRLEFSTTALRTKGLSGFMAELADKTKGSEETLAKLFPNVRALGPILQIVNGNMKDFRDILESTTKAQGATAEAAKIVKDSLDFKLDRLEQSIKGFGLSILSFFEPALKKGADALSALFDAMTAGSEPAAKRLKGVEKSLATLNEELKKAEKFETSFGGGAKGAYLNNVFGKSSEIKEKIKELSDLRTTLVKTVNEQKKGQAAVKPIVLIESKTEAEKLQEVKKTLSSLNKELQEVENFRNVLGGGADSDFLSDAFGSPEDIKEKIKNMEEMKASIVKIIDAQDASKKKLEDFIRVQKEAGDAGVELADKLTTSSKDIEEVHTARLNSVMANLETEKIATAQQKQDGLITTAQALEQTKELESSAFEEKLAAEEERRALLIEQIMAAREQDLIGDQTQKESLEQIQKDHDAKMIAAHNQSARTQLAISKQRRDLELQQRQTFLSTAATLATAENKGLAAIGKAAAITQIAIKTPPAVASSFEFGASLGGPPLGFAFAGIAGTAMAVQAAQIAGIPLQTGLTEVPSGFPNDSFNARLTSGERVLNVDQNKDFKEFLASQRSGQGRSIIFNLNVEGNITDSDEESLRIVERVRQFLQDNGGELLSDN